MIHKLGTYLFYVRLVQLLIPVAVLGENGWLISLIASGRLGLSSRMIAIEAISGIIMAYTSFEIFFLHCLHKSSKRRYLIAFFVLDMLIIGLFITNLTIFSIAGVPANCSGMTRENYNFNDAANEPAAGFTTIRFGPGTYGNAGQLDIYCDLPKSCYFLCILGILSYVISGSLSTVRILNSKQTCFKDLNKGKPYMKEIEPGLNNKLSASDKSVAESNFLSLPVRCLTDFQTARHELATPAAMPELESLSQRIELCSPVSPIEKEIEASVVNGSRGNSSSNPPAYMPASERTIYARSRAAGDGDEKLL